MNSSSFSILELLPLGRSWTSSLSQKRPLGAGAYEMHIHIQARVDRPGGKLCCFLKQLSLAWASTSRSVHGCFPPAWWFMPAHDTSHPTILSEMLWCGRMWGREAYACICRSDFMRIHSGLTPKTTEPALHKPTTAQFEPNNSGLNFSIFLSASIFPSLLCQSSNHIPIFHSSTSHISLHSRVCLLALNSRPLVNSGFSSWEVDYLLQRNWWSLA